MEKELSVQPLLEIWREEKFPSAQLHIHLFGGFELLQNGLPLPRTRTRTETWLLALLLLRANQKVERAWLAGTLWPETGPEQALNNLRRSLSNLRQVLGDESYRLVSPSAATLAFDLAGAFCDAAAFDAALLRGDEDSLRRGVALYRGALLPECDADWVLEERGRREQACLKARETLAAQARQKGDTNETVHWLRQALLLDPFRETTQCALMEALAAQGDRAGLTLAYRQFRLRLHEELQSEPSAETKALYQRLREQKFRVSLQPAPPAEDASRLHIPRPVSTLVGRQEERAEVTELLSSARLVTLTGTGGVGKTRLALDAALQAAARFSDGVWFVDLAPLTEDAMVENAVAGVLEVREEPGQTLIAALRGFLADKGMLILLDNCEHLLPACAILAATLLRSAPNLRILATSRQALGVSGERAWRVPSLSLPEQATSGAEGTPEALLAWPATRLFVERAQEASAAFTVTAHNAPFVADICRRLDGIPLAIELAAARVNALSAEQIAARLEDAFRLLTRGDRAALPRQQTLRALLDWSCRLLSPQEQWLLNALSVFAGGWTLEAAEAVIAALQPAPPDAVEPGDGLPAPVLLPEDVLDILASLIDKSLVVMQEAPDGGVRYRLLETVRQYAQERLAASGHVPAVRTEHGNYYLRLAEEGKQELRGSGQAQWLAVLEAEHDNLRQALRWFAAYANNADSGHEKSGHNEFGQNGLRMGAALQGFWLRRGHIREGQAWFTTFLEHPGGQEPTRARASVLHGAGNMAFTQGDYIRSQMLHEAGLTLRRALGDKKGIASSLGNLANIAYQQGDYAQSRLLDEEGVAINRELGDKWAIARSLGNLGTAAFYEGDTVRAQTLFEESLALQRELGDTEGITYTLAFLGNTAFVRGDYAQAWRLHQETLTLRRALGDKNGIASSLGYMASVACEQRDYAQARVLLAESLTIARELGNLQEISYALDGFADIACNVGQEERSVRLWGAAAALRESFGCVPPMLDSERAERNQRAVEERLGKANFEAAWTQGRAMTLEQAVSYALTQVS